MSLPSWERGLKLGHGAREVTQVRSLPSWERGLKQAVGAIALATGGVAPFVGAWIETKTRMTD